MRFVPNPQLRFDVAYLKINLGLTLKEIAQRLGIGEKNCEYYWVQAQKKIRKGVS